MKETHLSAWNVSEREFPRTGTAAQRLQFAVNYAVLAPSIHNTQPWRFKITDDSVELYADRRRAMPIADPVGRQLTISCGAALFNMRVALSHFGEDLKVTTLPDPSDPDLLARVTIAGPRDPGPTWHPLFYAITERVTHRRPFTEGSLPEPRQKALKTAAQQEGAWLALIEGDEARRALAELVAKGIRTQYADPRFRREVAAWIHPARSGDGLPVYSDGENERLDFAAPAVAAAIRALDIGESLARSDLELAKGSPLLACLGTQGDDPASWLAAGQALCHVLLEATRHQLAASFMNQPVEIPELRLQLGQMLDPNGFPQIVLRLGRGSGQKHTPRRPPDDVLIS
jgi:nitroreductase